ncbi:MAG: CDP-alcohol phosphatidyltransferase [Rhodobacterales bacterium]|nr:CDP-alcohol phosphatidyltransferase [Rhodobacterales bacterium]
MSAPSTGRVLAAWGVHLYTALGLPIAFVATIALFSGQAKMFFLALCLAVFVDATDGTLARKVGVKAVLPDFSGRKPDAIVDLLDFAFLPSLALAVLGMFPAGWEWAAVFPLMASGYGFCQEAAKTDDSFVGFPSYWNIGVLYLYLLQTGPWVNLAVIVVFSILVFMPFYYVYPTRTEFMKPFTVGFGYLWAATMTVLALNVDAEWTRQIAVWTLAYPAYYFAVSAVHHRQVVRRMAT